MKKSLLTLSVMGVLLLLGACDSASRIFDNNCSGNAMIENPGYCTGNFHPNAGPYANK
ncbi:MAG TPA: hypothetical protein VND94_19605 [Terriglobia bacterium]|nr:hypothetical protein [Terriglobia bacterium]